MTTHHHDHDSDDANEDHHHGEAHSQDHFNRVEHAGDSLSLKHALTWRRVLFGLGFIYILAGVYFVGPEEQAVVTRFGKVAAKGVGPGIHYHLPWPIERAVKLKVLETKRMTIGVEAADQVLGRRSAASPVQYLTADQNIISVEMAVQYAIKDSAAWLYHSQDVTQLVGRVVESAFARAISAEAVDGVLTTGKIAVQNRTLQQAREILDQYQSGVFLNSINIENVSPPSEVADAFRDVASARADRDRIINEAHGYANDALAKAAGEAEKLKSEATGYRQQRINEASGDADRFVKLHAEYAKAREITAGRLYLEAMEEILPRVKKVVIDSTGSKSLMDLGIIKPSP